MTQGSELRATTAATGDMINNAWAVWVKNMAALSNSISGKSMYYSQDDFTAVFATGTTLTIGAVGNLPAALTTQRIVKVIVTRLNGNKVTYDTENTAYTFAYAAPTLTVTGATFLATDLDYRVMAYFQAKTVEDDGVAPASTKRAIVAGMDTATGLTETPWIDGLGRVHAVLEAGNTPVTDTLTCTAAENVGDAVYNLAGVMRQANAGATATMKVRGVILSKPNATTAVVVYAGSCSSVAGLVPGAEYYANIVNGALTTVLPTLGGFFAELQRVGWADAAGELVVELGESYTL